VGQSFKHLNVKLQYHPTIWLRGIQARKFKTYVHSKTYTMSVQRIIPNCQRVETTQMSNK
jgi:hypothetical protein